MSEQNTDKIKENSSVSYTPEEADDFSVIEKRYSQTVEEDAKPAPNAEKTEEKENDKAVKKAKNKKGGALKRICLCFIIIIAVIFAAFAVYAFTLPTEKIVKGIKINKLDVGGMTKSEAALAIEEGDILSNHAIVLRSGEISRSITPSEIGASLDIDATVEKAFDFAKSKNPFENAVAALPVMFSGKSINPVISFDYDKLASIINVIGEEALGGALAQHSVRFSDDGKAYLVAGKSGYDGDPSAAIEQVNAALKNSISKEIDLTFEKKKPDEITVDKLDSLIYQMPEDASFALENGQVKINPEKVGRYINKDECRALLDGFPGDKSEVEIPYYTSQPNVTAAALQSKLFNAKLSSYTTRFNAGSVNRSANIANAASKLNGKILLPGEVFSFNETVGHRTVANGFKTAPEYQNGQTVDGIGGGTCQVSTTVYSAALYADLKIVKRSNHSMAVSYVPLGQDATVTDGGLDLKIENNTGYPIRLNASVSGGSITVSFTGTAPESAKTVKIIHTPVSVATGKAVKSERQVFDASGNLIRTDSLGTSRYKPHGSSSAAAQTSKPSASGSNAGAQKAAPAVKQQPTEAPPAESNNEGSAQPKSEESSSSSSSGSESSTPVKTE